MVVDLLVAVSADEDDVGWGVAWANVMHRKSFAARVFSGLAAALAAWAAGFDDDRTELVVGGAVALW
jgi:hypothetical protein